MLTWEPVNQPPINHTITEGKFRTVEAVNWSLIGKTAVAAVTGADSPGGWAREERYGGHLIIIILHSTRGSPGQAKALTASPLLSWPREHTSCLFTYVTQLWRLPFTSGWIFSACLLTFHFGLKFYTFVDKMWLSGQSRSLWQWRPDTISFTSW